jgi:hypothetical protein
LYLANGKCKDAIYCGIKENFMTMEQAKKYRRMHLGDFEEGLWKKLKKKGWKPG